MRIGFDAKRYFFNRTGLGNYSRDLVRILQTYYPENEYVLYSPKVPENFSPSDQLSLKTPTSFLGKLSPSFWRYKSISNDLKQDEIAIFHGLSGEIPLGLSDTSIKTVVTIHDLIFIRFPELYKPIDRKIYQKKMQAAADHADRIIAISEQTKQDIIDFLKTPEEKIQVVYQGCHPAFKTEKSLHEQNSVRNKYQLPEQFILNVGSIEPRKNAFQIVKAIEHTAIPLVIIGKDTSYAEEIKQYVEKNQMTDQVIFLKGISMEDLATIYSLAKIFVYPSKFEGFGIPIIEALYSGTPVITTNSGVFPEAAGPNSVFVNPENSNEISDAIQRIWADEDLQESMKIAGLEYAQRFNDDVLAKQIMDIYRSI